MAVATVGVLADQAYKGTWSVGKSKSQNGTPGAGGREIRLQVQYDEVQRRLFVFSESKGGFCDADSALDAAHAPVCIPGAPLGIFHSTAPLDSKMLVDKQ